MTGTGYGYILRLREVFTIAQALKIPRSNLCKVFEKSSILFLESRRSLGSGALWHGRSHDCEAGPAIQYRLRPSRNGQ